MDETRLSAYAEKILKRYSKSYVTDEQLLRYKELGAITQEEYEIIYATKHPVNQDPDAEDQSESSTE